MTDHRRRHRGWWAASRGTYGHWLAGEPQRRHQRRCRRRRRRWTVATRPTGDAQGSRADAPGRHRPATPAQRRPATQPAAAPDPSAGKKAFADQARRAA